MHLLQIWYWFHLFCFCNGFKLSVSAPQTFRKLSTKKWPMWTMPLLFLQCKITHCLASFHSLPNCLCDDFIYLHQIVLCKWRKKKLRISTGTFNEILIPSQSTSLINFDAKRKKGKEAKKPNQPNEIIKPQPFKKKKKVWKYLVF